MKTRIYLPVLSILALMLLSFTTNKTESGSIKQLADGNYVLQNVPLGEKDIYKLDQIAERISISDKLNEATAAKGFYFVRVRTRDENKFTEKTILGSSLISQLNEGDLEFIEKARGEIDEIMENYIR